MKTIRNISLLVLIAVSVFDVTAGKWFVKTDGSASTAGTTWAGAWDFRTFRTNLEKGIVEDGDEVYFAGGVYRISDLTALKITHSRLSLKGGYPVDLRVNMTPQLDYPTETPSVFIGDSNGSGKPDDYDARNIFYVDGSDTPGVERNILIEGFTLTGCFYEGNLASEAGAVCVNLARGVELRHCIIHGNSALYGGAAVSVSGGSVKITDCELSRNRAGVGGPAIIADSSEKSGVVYEPEVIIDRTLINDNLITSTDEFPDGNAPEVLYNGIVLPATWPPKNMSPQSREPMPVPYLEPENIPAVIPIYVGRQLFVDDFLIEDATGVTRKWYQPEKYSGNPVLKVETDLEKYSAGNPGAAPKDGGVYWDEAEKIFKMWYEAGWLHTQAYATSEDGIHWKRPALGIGTLNQILPGYAPNSSGVVVDYDAPAYERYKIYFRPPNAEAVSNIYGYAAISADGIHWNNLIQSGASGDRSTFFYNPFRKKYVFSLRNGGGLGPSPHGRNRWYRESSDFLTGANWSPRNVVYWCGADNLDLPDPEVGIAPELYNVNAVAYESVMLGMLQIFLGPQNETCKALGIPKRTDLKVGFSRDGFHWSRPEDRTSFIPSSGGSVWDKGYVQSVGGICSVVGDQLRFYYIGFRGDETRPGTGYGMHANSGTGIAVLRRDGFCSISSEEEGCVTTRPIKFDGKYLYVNADAKEGSVEAELLDADGNAVEGFLMEESLPMKDDSTIYRMAWQSGKTLDHFSGKPVRIRFRLRNAHLYSFWVSPDETGASRGYVAGGGPGYKTNMDMEGIDAYEAAASYQVLK